MTYLISEVDRKRQKLLAKVLAPFMDRLLNVLQLPQDLRCLDLGCGIGETTRRLARKLDNPREVIGVELSTDLVEAARGFSSGLENRVAFEQGDVARLQFADNSFDFVFARYLLMHLPEPDAVLKEMLRVCKPGGVVAAVEPDFSYQRCYPDSWAYERMPALLGGLFPDPFIGRKLWSLFRESGFDSANTLVDCFVETDTNDLRRLWRMTIEAVSASLIEKGVIREQEFERLHEEMKRVEQGKNVLCVSNPVFSVFAVKS